MQKLAHIDGEGRVLGFYEEGTHRNIPAPNIALSDDAYGVLLAGQAAGKTMKVLADGTPHVADLSMEDTRATLLDRIDAAADAARLAVAGDPLRAAEYQVAEAEAKAYRAAGYAGTVPQSIKSWAEAKQWTAKRAAEDILAEALAWNGALYALRDARLKAKEAVRNAGTAEDAEAVAMAAIDSINARVADRKNAPR